MRIIWFWIALTISGLAAYFAYDAFPDLFNWLTGSDLSPGYLSVLKTSLMVVFSGRVALAVMFFAVLGLVVPAIYESVALARVTAKIRSFPAKTKAASTMPALAFQAELGDFRLVESAVPAYARSLVEQHEPEGKPGAAPTLKALVPAETFFGPAIFVEEHLLGWLFRPLGALALSCGLIIFIAACLTGFHDYREALPLDPVGGAGILWSWVEKGLFSLSFAATGALIALIITRLTLELHTTQVRAFCRLLDEKFAYSPMAASTTAGENRKARDQQEKLVADLARGFEASQQELVKKLVQALDSLEHRLGRSIEASLRPPLEQLTEISGQVAGKQSELTASVITSALETFIRNLEKELGGQFAKTNALLKSTALLSAKVEKGFLGSLKDLERHNDAQSATVSAVSREINETLGGLKGFEKALEQAVTSIQPTLDRVLENQAALLTALGDEKSAGKTIKDAAAEMGKAAKASKDTIESFITLAEKLTEASRSLSAPGAAPAAPPRLATGDGAAQGSKLGQAIRGLRDKAETTGKLPKL